MFELLRVAIVLATLGATLVLDAGQVAAQEAGLSVGPPTESPRDEFEAQRFETQSSVVVADVVLSYPALQQAFADLGNGLAGSRSGSERVGCTKLLFDEACLDVDWSVDYRLSGPVQVSPQEGLLHLVLPVSFDGRADLRGAVADLLGLDGQGFSGALQVSATFALSFDERFCPIIEPSMVSFNWDQGATIEIGGGAGMGIGPWRLPVGSSLEGPLRDSLMGLLREHANIIPCQPVRDELARLWRTYAFRLDIEGMPALFANVEPTALSISQLHVEHEGVRLVVRMAAEVAVSEERGPEIPIAALPRNETIPVQDGTINLAVPLALSYPTIREQALAALGAAPLSIDTSVGAANVRVEDLRVHPSGGTLAMGVDVVIDAPGALFDTHGKVWLAANPIVEAEGTRVRLTSVALLQQLESPVWTALAGASTMGFAASHSA